MTPERMEFEVGKTVYGQRVVLIRHRDTAGRTVWMIHKHAESQRDEDDKIAGLTAATLTNIADAVRAHS